MNRRRLAELELAPRWRRRAVPNADAGAADAETIRDRAPVSPPTAALATAMATPGAQSAMEISPEGVTGAGAALPSDRDARRDALARMDWDEIESAIAACRACDLHAGRRQAVPGVGDRSASWLFVGEGPGAEEDAKGEPFVGQAGRLLDNMFKSIGLARGHDVYIANVVKCRPPQNRTPTPEEANACFPFLSRQIELIRPSLIVALGKTAILGLLGTDAPMAALRGRVHRYRDIPVIVTYHPAYLLRKPIEKSKAWEDLCLAVDTRTALQTGRIDPI